MPKHVRFYHDSTSIDELQVPTAYDSLPLDEACRAYAQDLIANADTVVESYEEKLSSERFVVKILKWIGIVIVLLGAVFGAIFGVHEVLNTLRLVTQPGTMLILWCVITVIGYIAMAALIALGMAEILNYLFGDPYHRGRDLCEEYEVILHQLRLEQKEDHQRAAQYLAAADELERRAREAQERQQYAQSCSNQDDGGQHSESQDNSDQDDCDDEPRFRLVQGGRG